MSHVEMLLRPGLAAALGSVIGIERERLQWTAGLTTAGMSIRTVRIEPGEQPDEDVISVGVQSIARDKMLTTLERLRLSKGVRSVALR